MVNSAVEAAIDVATTSFDPLAKLAKDIAAGAVLIAAVNAVAVGYLVFSGEVADRSSRLLDRLRDAPAQLTLIALVADDHRRDRDEGDTPDAARRCAAGSLGPCRGRLRGLDGGDVHHRRPHRFSISSLTFIMALLVAQTRVEAGVHSALEVASGGVLGALITLVVFQVFA